ncbi:putative membrane protein [Rhodococcus ruber]|nr:putative membrane protein [Rhodococcus ruber]
MSARPRPLPQLRMAAAAYRFRESLFALPTLIVAAGVILAEVTAYLDRTLPTDVAGWAVQMNSNGATWLLSTVAGATITTAGVVFSLTVVSLQLASSQFSPRVMRSFIRDRVSQTVIGMLVATFVYCVLTLRHVGAEAAEPAPGVSMTVALVLTVATVVLIVAYLDRLAHGLQVGEVVRTIATEADGVLDAAVRESRTERPAAAVSRPASDAIMTVPAVRDGWVTQAPTEHLLASVPPSTVVRLETRPGAYIHRGEVLLRVWPVPDRADRVRRRLEAAVEISDTRTMQQDVDFALRQLVDIGLRALSSAINDPTTATEVVLRIGSLLRTLLTAEVPPLSVAGADGRVLLRPWMLSPPEYVEHAFEQIRQACPRQLHVATAVARVLRMLTDHVRAADRDEHVPELERQLRLLVQSVAAEPGHHPEDLARFRAVAESPVDPAEHEVD